MENTFIHDFFAAQNVPDRFKALLELNKNRKRIHEAAKSPDFSDSLEACFKEALTSGSPEDMLMATAAISRVSSIVKSFRKNAQGMARKYISERLPSPGIMQNPDDRYYIAKTCNMIASDWVADYLAQAAIEEENAERARAEYVAGLFKSVGSLQIAFDILTQKLSKWNVSTEKPEETVARRLKRVLGAVQPALMEYEGEITPDAGGSLARMVRIRKGLELLDQDIRRELASEVAETIHNLIRARFSLATDSATYEAIRVAKRWFPEYRWEDFAKGAASLRKVASDLLEGITLLARQGITDSAMFECLTIVLGSEDNARRKTAELGRSLSSLTDDVRQWLITGHMQEGRKPSEATDLSIRSAEHRENLLLSSHLLDIERFNRRIALIQKECLTELEVLDPNIAKGIEIFLEQARTVVDGFRSICSRRGLKIRGNINEVVEYSPLEHDVVTGSAQGIRMVRVIEPVVEKINEAGIPSIVRKGIVEPC